MNLDFSEEQLMLRDSARDFLTKNCPKKIVRALEESESGFSPEMWRQMADLGWMGLVLPEEYGGAEMTFLDLAVLLEETGRACLPGPFFSTVILGALPILDLGTEDQKQQLLPKVAKGELKLTFASTEESGRYDSAGIRTVAVRDGDDYVLNGVKLFVPDAHVADYILCVARNDSTDPDAGLTIFLVGGKQQGVTCTPLKTISNEKLCEVVLDRVRVSDTMILGRPGEGGEQMERIIERAAAAKCCEMVGCLQAVFEMTLAYAKERVAFGQPIGSFQAVQHHCANMAIDVYGTMLSAYQAAWKISEGLECGWEVAVAKAWASAACPRVIALAHQIHGAIGTTMDHELHYYTRRTKAAESAFGDVDYYMWKVAAAVSK